MSYSKPQRVADTLRHRRTIKHDAAQDYKTATAPIATLPRTASAPTTADCGTRTPANAPLLLSVLVLDVLDIVLLPDIEPEELPAEPVLEAAEPESELDAELCASRTKGAAVRKAWPPNVVVPPTVPGARVMADPPMEETITTGAEFASANRYRSQWGTRCRRNMEAYSR